MKSHHWFLGAALLACSLFWASCGSMQMYLKSREVRPLAHEIVRDVRGQPVGGGVTSPAVPGIETWKAGMTERYQQLRPYYISGAVKENEDGYVYVRDVRRADIDTRRMLAGTIRRENEARQGLYRKIAEHLGIGPEHAECVPRIFAQEWAMPVE